VAEDRLARLRLALTSLPGSRAVSRGSLFDARSEARELFGKLFTKAARLVARQRELLEGVGEGAHDGRLRTNRRRRAPLVVNRALDLAVHGA
jgi:hypothetical protein